MMSLPELVQRLSACAQNFVGGRLHHFFDKWKQITSDPEILALTAEAKLEFNGDTTVLPQIQTITLKMNATESAVIDEQIDSKMGDFCS